VITSIVVFMVSKLQTELKQTKPFRSLEEEALLNLERTNEYLSNKLLSVIKEKDLTATQYNVLRILRGAGEEGLICSEISERMVTKESDITRLLDRLENRLFITRERPANNRRIVIARITGEGLNLLAELDAPVDDCNVALLGHLGQENLTILNNLLVAIRNPN
jgi:DNA-binding MarR family transcriptional regulator